MRSWIHRFFLVSLFFLPTLAVRGQDAAGLTGTVTDISGALLPGATVILTNTSTGTQLKQVTDAKGSYRFPNVAPGPGYVETISRAGFSTVSFDHVSLSVGVTRTQDAQLSPGAAEQVSVNAGTQEETLNTSDASIGNNVSPEQLNELPVYDRTNGIATLFYLQPGVDSATGSVTGARIDQTEVTVDGLDVNDIAAGTTFAVVGTAPVDSVEEFRGTVAGLVPSIGTGSGGQFQLVTKSGTNAFHGDLNEYNRNTDTVANTYFNNLVGLPRTPLIRNQFGGALGGPIKKDKLFFFFDFNDSRIIQSSTAERTVPLASYLAGNINYINNNPGCTDSSRLNTTPNCISTLPAISTNAGQSVQSLDPAKIGFNPNVLSYLKTRYPAVNDVTQGDGVNTGGYRFTTPTPDFDTTYVTRIDYNLTPSQKVFGRFTINREDATESLQEFAADPQTHPFKDRSYGYVVSDIWTIGQNKVNQFYYGDNISKLSFPDVYNPTGINQYSFSGLSGPYTSYDGQQRRVPIPVVRDDFNWQIGSHSLTLGGTFKFIKTNSDLINNFNFVDAGLQGSSLSAGLDPSVRPSNINASPQGTAVNDYDQLFSTALGVIGEVSTNYDYTKSGAATPLGSGGPRAYRYYETEAYVGDTWKFNKKLTFSYGLRYQYYTVPYEAHGDESVEVDNTNNQRTPTLNSYFGSRLTQLASANPVLPIYSVVLGGKANNGPSLYSPSYKDLAPRFAFSYSPYSDGKTVFNGSAGIVYDRTVINAINFLQDQVSYLFSNTQTNQLGGANDVASLATDPRIGANLSFPSAIVPAPAALTTPYTPYVTNTGALYGLAAGETNFVISPNLKDPYNIVFNAGVQQELPGHLIMRLNYAGRLGRRLLADADAGQVVNTPDTSGKSNQNLSQAFAGLTSQLRAGTAVANLSAQPWFENVLAPNTGVANNFANNTQLVAALLGQLANRGDIADSFNTLAYYTTFGGLTGFLPTNVGVPSQFGSNTYLTNLGSSSYNALLLTLSRNYAQGLRFDFNYTWSHSIDNTSLSANGNSLFSNSGFICDLTQPRACRGSSDFDVRQEINANFLYDLPFGRGKMFLGNVNHLVDEAIGGWSLSGVPSYRTGVAVPVNADAFLASFDNNDYAIFTGNKGDLKTKVNNVDGTVYQFAGGAAGASKVLSEFRGPLGIEYGQRNLVSGPGAFFFDAGLAKDFAILSDNKLNLKFRADAFNVLNHPNFSAPQNNPYTTAPALNIVTNASPFGQITSTVSSPGNPDDYRVAQFSLRLEF